MPKILQVLIVEDSENDMALLLRELRRGPWQIRHKRVDTSDEMSKALEAQPWDIIIADYSMPTFTGPAALALARQQETIVPFILVSGTMGEDTAVAAMKAGADDYLFKGDLNRLVPAVEREIRDAEGRQKARLTEQQLRRRETQIADAQRLAHLGTWHVDVRTGLAVWSEEAIRIIGRKTEDPTATLDDFLGYLHPDDRTLFTKSFHTPGQTSITQDLRIMRRDTTLRYIHLVGEITRDESGQAQWAAGMIQDVTEQTLSATELHEAKETAERANRSKSEFLANMSHEIRTPMTAIVGFADMMLRRDANAPDHAECIQAIRRNAFHLLELINEILDLSKIEAGQMTIEQIRCDLAVLLTEVSSLMRSRAEEKSLEFKVKFEGVLPRHIKTDPMRLRQILVNLLGNAIKFTTYGSVELRVRWEPTDNSGTLRIAVCDTGIGLSTEQKNRLFQPFTQGEESTTRKFGGTGLGLTISRRIARLLGGDVTVTSELGKGSAFEFSIDTGAIESSDLISDMTESGLPAKLLEAEEERTQIRGRILLAEDGADNRRLLSSHLEMAGAEVTIAENGKVAVDLCTREAFDAVLMDMQMPEMDGYSATAELRRRGILIPIIALTAFAMSDDRAKCMASGCSDYLAKPVDSEVLLRTLSRHLGQAAGIAA